MYGLKCFSLWATGVQTEDNSLKSSRISFREAVKSVSELLASGTEVGSILLSVQGLP